MTAPAVARRWADLVPDPGVREVPAVAPAYVGRGVAPSDPLGLVMLRAQLIRLRAAAPLGALLATVLLTHVALAPQVALGGVGPDVVLAGVVAVAVARGPRAGAGFGFAAGLGADLFLATPVGTAALAFTLVGYVLGQSSRTGTRGTASALCRPGSSCFACRSVALTAFGVGAGRLGTAVVATALGGMPFLDGAGGVRIATVAAITAPLGPGLFAALRRLPGPTGHR